MLHIEFFSTRSINGMMAVKAAVIGRLPVAYALCGSSLIKVVASLHDRFSVVIIALSRTVAVWDYDKMWSKKKQSKRIKEKLLLRFPPAELNKTPPAGRNNGRLEGTDLQADVAEDILNCYTLPF